MHVEFRVDQFSFYERTLNQNKDYFDRKVVNKIKPSINELLKILEVIKSDTLVILAIRKAQEIYRLSSHSDNIRHEVKKKNDSEPNSCKSLFNTKPRRSI
jgi:hypothetical protein